MNGPIVAHGRAINEGMTFFLTDDTHILEILFCIGRVGKKRLNTKKWSHNCNFWKNGCFRSSPEISDYTCHFGRKMTLPIPNWSLSSSDLHCYPSTLKQLLTPLGIGFFFLSFYFYFQMLNLSKFKSKY